MVVQKQKNKRTAKESDASKSKPKSNVAKKEKEVLQSEEPKLRLRVSAYEHKVLDSSVKQIMDITIRYDANVKGPIPLPTEIKKYTVNRSTFIFEDSREQFEMRVHRRLIDILSPSSKVVDALTNLSLPSGVKVDVKMM